MISGDRRGGALPAIPPQTTRAIVRVVVSNPYVEARRFGGAAEDELNDLGFSAMARAKTWQITPSLADIQTIMARVGAANTILSINYRQPFVLDRASGMDRAGAILATFGVSDHALMDVLSGRFNPQGRLPLRCLIGRRRSLTNSPICRATVPWIPGVPTALACAISRLPSTLCPARRVFFPDSAFSGFYAMLSFYLPTGGAR
ncbi:hypothetical protein O0544_07670 [Edwardsiella anguillarum]|nr:hypothetical protein [Edwardsiella anguillarum]